MRIKLQRDYKQLPAGSHLRLIEALVAHLKNLHNAPGPLVTQLCLAIASLAVNLFGAPHLALRSSCDATIRPA